MPNLPGDLIEITSYNSKYGNIDLKGLMYSPSEKALYNKGFLNKKINLNNKRNFYTYAKSEDPNERKRICINIDRFIRQYPEYKNIQEISDEDKYEENNQDNSIEKSIEDKSNDNSNEISNEKSEDNNSNEISENKFLDILNEYKD
mgnify:CR=1 FL=1